MNLDLTDEQQMLRENFARFLNAESTPARVREAAGAGGFDAALWRGLAELGTFAIRVPEDRGGLGLGTFDATLLMEECGRTLASGPIVEAIVAASLLAKFEDGEAAAVLPSVIDGGSVASIAFHDVAVRPVQLVAGGGRADLIVAAEGDRVVLFAPDRAPGPPSMGMLAGSLAQIDFSGAKRIAEFSAHHAASSFAGALEEWMLLTSALLNGIAREAVRLAAAYASERHAFGVPIGAFQAISHPLANIFTDIEGGRLLVWKAIYEVASGDETAGAHVPLALWWSARTATSAGIQSLRTFGGYGLTTEYDIYLYNLRAKTVALSLGDPAHLLERAGERLYGDERAPLPDVGPLWIDLDLGPEAEALANEVDAFFVKTLTPELKAHAHYSWDGHHPDVHRKLAAADLLFPAWPKAKGGRGVPPYSQHAARRVWEKHGWTSHAKGTTMMVAAMIDRFGSEELKREVFDPIMRGEVICSLGYSEPGSGSDVFAARTKATPDGNGWRVDGTKMFTSGANIADYVLMLTRTNPDVPKHKGLTMFVVPLKADGVSIHPVFTFQEERTNVTFYDGVRIPDSYRLGDVDGGVRTMSAGLELEHGGGFSMAQSALIREAEELCRQIPGVDGRPLIEDGGARARLARATAHYLIADMLELRSLWAAEEKREIAAVGPMAKMFSSERFLEDASDLLDLTAPLSLTDANAASAHLNLGYRHAHGTTIYGGTSEVHRSMIAERALGLPRSRGN